MNECRCGRRNSNPVAGGNEDLNFTPDKNRAGADFPRIVGCGGGGSKTLPHPIAMPNCMAICIGIVFWFEY